MAGAAHRDERAAHRRSALGRVRGLGSAKEGVQHWWMQRLTAIALVPLLVWFVASILAHIGADHANLQLWIGSPVVFALMLAMIGAGFWHMALGLQVVIEDYVRSEALKLGLIVFVQFAALALALAAATALLVIAFGG
ncbi:MAG: succinate dehydrogenase, hydrophobic membrane anchor protein [Dongiaceae bacterium]|jgi:succinate dehydrogenase / fumarate reductase membrane anchor subunit